MLGTLGSSDFELEYLEDPGDNSLLPKTNTVSHKALSLKV